MTDARPEQGPSTSVDPVRTEDDWDTHWDRYASAAEANPAQRYRRDLVLRLLAQAPGRMRLVDLGSGQGDLLARVATAFPDAELVGIEPSGAGNAVASAKVPRARLSSIDIAGGADAGELEGWATHLVCSEVLEHVDDDIGLLRAARRLMGPGCRVIVTVPGGRMSAFDRHIGHRRHYDRRSLAGVLSGAGLRVERVMGAGFPVFNLYRGLVILRGERLIGDASAGPSDAAPTRLAQLAMRAIGPMFRVALDDSRLGIQMVGVATGPSS